MSDQGVSSDQQQVVRLQHELQEAVKRRDGQALDLLVAGEFTLCSSRGFTSRDDWMDMARRYELQEFAYEDIRVNIYGDVAVASSRYRQTATTGGTDVSGTWFMTDIWVRHEPGWRLVTRHPSRSSR